MAMNSESKCFALALLGASVIGPHAAEVPNEPDDVLSIEWVVSMVLSNNPSLKGVRANWEASKVRVRQARAWEDPRVGVDVERSGTTQFDNWTDAEWMLGQQVPLSGKNRWRGRAATAEADGAFADVHRRELELTARARAAFYRL